MECKTEARGIQTNPNWAGCTVKQIDNGPHFDTPMVFLEGVGLAIVLVVIGFFLGKIK